mgnify:CR=1 FL=1
MGRLSGYAWGENAGWVNFAPANSGVFLGYAYLLQYLRGELGQLSGINGHLPRHCCLRPNGLPCKGGDYGGYFAGRWKEREADALLRDVSALILVRFCHMMPLTLSSKGKVRMRVHPRAAFDRPMAGGTDDDFVVEL